MPSASAAFASADARNNLMLDKSSEQTLIEMRGVCRSFPKGRGEDLLVL